MTDYSKYELTSKDIASKSYKALMGGGPEEWEQRGKSQLEFMQSCGLLPQHKMLDVGCGILRGGVFFIDYLEPGNYFGIEGNPSFVMASEELLKEKGMVADVQQSWEFRSSKGPFDFALAFSVLNHCGHEDRRKFFSNAVGWLKPGGKAYVTHAKWFRPSILKGLPLNSKVLNVGKFFSPVLEIQRRRTMKDWLK